ncbi:EscF/YscF/HrpA family type III secretion system needle major subunit [Yersinia hibernica]|uniref:Type III secretion apparatus needle protein n=1 Tax=Yersinia hibernica TaxID=2339259 RepID=A0ABX5R4U9_9GAMM|nr:EscF/YscF/HrpA family type III secretion system needle major subunit [Yersinia hibernica]QAX80383.1 type III secretion apparatus needle protein [Yersinia hibernica]
MAVPGLESNGNWSTSAFETVDTTSTSNWGMQYRSGALLNTRVKELADQLKSALSDTKNEMDNPIVLAKISALNGHYNSARQAQSNIMKSIKDTSQAIIRNM